MNIVKPKKIPLRKCIVTGNQHPKQELIRVVRSATGEVTVDPTGKVRGHGVYLERNIDTILKAQKKHLLNRALETQVPDTIYEELIHIVEDKA